MKRSFANSLTALSIAFASLTTLAFIAQPVVEAPTVQLAAQHDQPATQQDAGDDSRTTMQIIEDERNELARRAMIRAGTGLHFFNTRLYDTEANPSTVSQ